MQTCKVRTAIGTFFDPTTTTATNNIVNPFPNTVLRDMSQAQCVEALFASRLGEKDELCLITEYVYPPVAGYGCASAQLVPLRTPTTPPPTSYTSYTSYLPTSYLPPTTPTPASYHLPSPSLLHLTGP